MPVGLMQTVHFVSDTLRIANQSPAGLRIDLPAPVGFSALITGRIVNGSTQFNNWQIVTPPRYNFGGFNPTTGVFTVPSTGIYSVNATIYYIMNTVACETPNGIFPFFSVRNVNNGNYLISGLLPVLHVSLGVRGELRSILNAATVTLADNLLLSARDNIALTYEADSLDIALEIGNRRPPGIVWSIEKLSDA